MPIRLRTGPREPHDRLRFPLVLLAALLLASLLVAGFTLQLLSAHRTQAVELTVTDQGPGLTPEELQRIRHGLRRRELGFSKRGSGIGLALVEQIALAHHGYLVLDKATGQDGLKVVVSFPVAARQEPT